MLKLTLAPHKRPDKRWEAVLADGLGNEIICIAPGPRDAKLLAERIVTGYEAAHGPRGLPPPSPPPPPPFMVRGEIDALEKAGASIKLNPPAESPKTGKSRKGRRTKTESSSYTGD